MNRFARFALGSVVAAALAFGALAAAPRPGSAKPVLGCSGNYCCTFDDVTGQIYSCVRIE